jgi:hypothetical protein
MTVTSECATTPAEILNEALAGLRKEDAKLRVMSDC